MKFKVLHIKVGYSYDKADGEYSEKLGGPSWDWVDHMKLGKIQGLKFKNIIYKIKNKAGKNVVNFGTVDFLESKYKTAHKTKKYNFGKYVSAVGDSQDEKEDNLKSIGIIEIINKMTTFHCEIHYKLS